jgi:hypothetical protein
LTLFGQIGHCSHMVVTKCPAPYQQDFLSYLVCTYLILNFTHFLFSPTSAKPVQAVGNCVELHRGHRAIDVLGDI